MSHHNPETPIVAVSHARSFNKNEVFFSRHQPLAEALGRHGATLIALNGAKDRTDGKVFTTYYSFENDDLLSHNQEVSVDSALDITGGIARYTPSVAALNPLRVREIALSKQLQYDALKELGEHVAETRTARADYQSVVDALELFDAPKMIVKAETDVEKKYGMAVGSRQEILAQLTDVLAPMNPETDQVIIQEYMDEVNAPFANDLVFANNQEREAASTLKDLGREIRVHTIDGRPILVTGRAGLDAANKSPLDDWIYVDQNAVPKHITELASNASRLIMDRAQAASAYLAVDLTPDGSRIVEVNGRNIGTMRLDAERKASAEAHIITTNEIAKKLVSMAHNKDKES